MRFLEVSINFFSYAGMIRQVRGSGLQFAQSQPVCTDSPKILICAAVSESIITECAEFVNRRRELGSFMARFPLRRG